MSNSKAVATVKFFDHSKGYGFLTDGSGDDVFCHYRNIEPGTSGYKGLSPGQRVEYEPTITDKGLAATRIIIAD